MVGEGHSATRPTRNKPANKAKETPEEVPITSAKPAKASTAAGIRNKRKAAEILVQETAKKLKMDEITESINSLKRSIDDMNHRMDSRLEKVETSTNRTSQRIEEIAQRQERSDREIVKLKENLESGLKDIKTAQDEVQLKNEDRLKVIEDSIGKIKNFEPRVHNVPNGDWQAVESDTYSTGSRGAVGSASVTSVMSYQGSLGSDRSGNSASAGESANSLPSSRSSSPGANERWGQKGSLTSYVKIEGIDYPFSDGTYYDQMATNALRRSIRDSMKEIVLIGVPDENNPDKDARMKFERQFCLEMLRELDSGITYNDIKYYKRFNGPRIRGKPKHMAIGMEEEEVAQALISLAEDNNFEEIRRSWPKIERVDGKAYAYKRHGNSKIEIVVHPNPECFPEYVLEHPFKDYLAANAKICTKEKREIRKTQALNRGHIQPRNTEKEPASPPKIPRDGTPLSNVMKNMISSFAVNNPEQETGTVQKKTKFTRSVQKLAVSLPQNLPDVQEDEFMESQDEGEDKDSPANTSSETIKNDEN